MCPKAFLEAIWFGFEITKKPSLKDVPTNIGMTYNHLQPSTTPLKNIYNDSQTIKYQLK